VLSPAQAMILPFFSGERSYGGLPFSNNRNWLAAGGTQIVPMASLGFLGQASHPNRRALPGKLYDGSGSHFAITNHFHLIALPINSGAVLFDSMGCSKNEERSTRIVAIEK
jgi:hypothetical protein